MTRFTLLEPMTLAQCIDEVGLQMLKENAVLPWFKVDDTFPHHAKVMAAGNAAVGLWVRAGAWSMQQLTDGFVPDHVVRALGTAKEARALVTAGLWLRESDGYRFHDWDDMQRSKAQVKADRDAATERQRRAREAAKSRAQSRRDTTVSHGPPDQTRPDQKEEEPRARRASQLPSDFAPNETNRRIAEERGLDLAAVLEQFTDYHRAKGTTYKDWHAGLNTWLRREPEGTRRRAARPPRPEELEQPPDGLSPEGYAEWERGYRARLADRRQA